MTREFKVGDRVRLSDMGRERFTDTKTNPHDAVGVVVVCNVDFGWDYDTKVDWPNEGNYYNHADLTHAEPVPIGYTGKLRDMDLREGDVVRISETLMTFKEVIPDGEEFHGEYQFCGYIMVPDDKGTLISRATTANHTNTPTWSDWQLSRKDGYMAQQYAEVQTVSLDDTQQVVYRGRGVPVRREVMTVSVAIVDGQPDWDTVEEVVL